MYKNIYSLLNNGSSVLHDKLGFADNDAKDRRLFARKEFDRNGILLLKEHMKFFGAYRVIVHDISLGGVLVRIENKSRYSFTNKFKSIELAIKMADDEPPMVFRCDLVRIDDADNAILMALTFIDSAFFDYQRLAAHLQWN